MYVNRQTPKTTVIIIDIHIVITVPVMLGMPVLGTSPKPPPSYPPLPPPAPPPGGVGVGVGVGVGEGVGV